MAILIYKNIITIEEKEIKYGLKELCEKDRELLKQVVAEISISRFVPEDNPYDITKLENAESIKSIPNLNKEKKDKIEKLIWKYKDVFS